jgi:isocitrate dehydrogenase
VFEKYGELFDELGVNPNNGMNSVLARSRPCPSPPRTRSSRPIHDCYEHRPEMAMVDSVKGITNLHVPSDVIVDASMPAMIRNSGQMWGRDGKLKDTKAVMPESTYARIYQEVINFCKTNGAFDPRTMGSVPNVGLMAHEGRRIRLPRQDLRMLAKTAPCAWWMENGQVLMQHEVEKGDIWRACQTKDAPIRDWVKLAVNRARQLQYPGRVLAGPERAHDRELRRR